MAIFNSKMLVHQRVPLISLFHYNNLVGGFSPLKNDGQIVSWDDEIPN